MTDKPFINDAKNQFLDQVKDKYLSADSSQNLQDAGVEIPREGDPYPKEVAAFTSYLVRQGYIREVTNLIGPQWRTMSQDELTAWLSANYTEDALKEQFLAKYSERQAIKSNFRKINILSAIVLGLIWARENIQKDEWAETIAKVGAAGISAYIFNKALYARDSAAAAIMKKAEGQFGKWFQGAARTNRFVNRLSEVAVIASLSEFFMSGGYDYPNIPFDIIYEIDILDETTWKEPNQTLLDFGFNIWYRQRCTDAFPQACGGNVYLATVYGSLIKTILEATILSRPAY